MIKEGDGKSKEARDPYELLCILLRWKDGNYTYREPSLLGIANAPTNHQRRFDFVAVQRCLPKSSEEVM